MCGAVVFVADAGEEAGLGHVSRSSAIAVALACRGVETRCFAYGSREAFTRDGVTWLPLDNSELPVLEANVLVIDSYRLTQEDLSSGVSSPRRVIMHDFDSPPQDAALVVSVAGARAAHGKALTGFAYAALRPRFWGLPTRVPAEGVERVLVSTGSGHFDTLGVEIARALVMALPATAVSMVRGPYGTTEVPVGVEPINAPESLLEPLLVADLAITAGGQTMLEAAATGTPCIALPLVENQRTQVELLGGLGAVSVVDPPIAAEVVAEASALIRDWTTRQAMSRAGQKAVDGYGALRVAFEIARLARTSR